MPKVYGFAEYGGPDQQDFWDQPKPTPGPSELLIAVRAAGVNPVDVKIRSGAYHAFMPVDLPAVIGQEAAGVVEEVGKDVEGFSVGDEVLGATAPGSGGFAEYTLLTADTAVKKPVHVSFSDAAALPVAAVTAFTAIRQLALTEGQTLLILGIGGGVGVAAAQIARDQGLNVIGTGSDGKRGLVESLRFDIEGITADNDHAVIFGELASRVRMTGKIIETAFALILKISGGQVVRLQMLEDSFAVSRAARLGPAEIPSA